MKHLKKILIGLVIISFPLSATFAYSENAKPPRDKKINEVLKELNLSPEQEKKLAENRTAKKEEMKKLRDEMRKSHEKLQEAMKNPDTTIASVEPIVNDIKASQSQLIDNRIKGIFAVREILSAEQFSKFQGIMAKHHKEKKR
ncbi:secreted protein [Candidatus Omnitrophus magneticus]|uniref:Secreted protein n=1 Tax=Candidatus Omnitrophus magneticus TaxID=1609969 RepID=A0A0F0CNT0_9BACT|nr:secreted protein [Candidatus Omnitrophus magneticus]